MIARAGPDENGRWGLASLVIDSTLDDLGFLDLLPADLRAHLQIDVVFLDAEEFVVLLNQRIEFRWRVDEPFQAIKLAILRHSAIPCSIFCGSKHPCHHLPIPYRRMVYCASSTFSGAVGLSGIPGQL